MAIGKVGNGEGSTEERLSPGVVDAIDASDETDTMGRMGRAASTWRSGTRDYPTPRELIVALLEKLVTASRVEAWAHFELEKRTGRISRLFAGFEECVEVALTKERFELSKGLLDVAIPSSWSLRTDGIIDVPLAERDLLARWIDSYFQPVIAEDLSYTLKGWLDGL